VESAEKSSCPQRAQRKAAKHAKKINPHREEVAESAGIGNEKARRRIGRNAMFRPVVKSANTKSFDCVRLPLTSLRITEGKSSGAFDSLKMI
jgi:hypothetical protein